MNDLSEEANARLDRAIKIGQIVARDVFDKRSHGLQRNAEVHLSEAELSTLAAVAAGLALEIEPSNIARRSNV
jgi:hypothetical protein